MKNLKLVILTGILGLFFALKPTLSASAQNFEGVIHYNIQESMSGSMEQMTYMIKDAKTRIEFGKGNQKGAMLFLPEESKSVVIMDQMQGYVTFNPDSLGNPDQMDSEFNMEKTGENKTIADQSCEVWIINSKEEQYEVCMASGLGGFMMPGHPMGGSPNLPRWAREAIEEGVMPLEVVHKKDDQTSIQMQATQIEKKSLDASLFEVPEGYQDLSGMLNQMMNRNKN